jgi:hypothetical protein
MPGDDATLHHPKSLPSKQSENLMKIDAELVRCRQRLDDLKLLRSLEAREKT